MGIPADCEPAGHGPSVAKDRVLVTTVHQPKGREWDVVIAGSLSGTGMETDRVGRTLSEHGVYSGEPEGYIADYHRARQHFVAFTRARNLLVLTTATEPHARFASIWSGAVRWPSVDSDALARQRFGSTRNTMSSPVIEIAHLDRLVLSHAGNRGI